MKKLYEFKVPKTETVEESKKEKRDDGTEVTVTQNVEKSVEHTYFIRKPTRAMFDEAELFYAVTLSEGIKAGLLTRALLLKRFNNDGGILSDDQQKSLSDLYTDILEKQNEFQRLSLKTKSERTKEEQDKYRETLTFLHESRKQIQDFETAQASLYDQTAENRARNKTILWWILSLSYEFDDKIEQEKDKNVPVFSGEGYKEKLDVYDEIEEEDDEYLTTVISKFSYYVSFWYVSKANTKEEFDELLQMTESTDQSVDDILKQEEEEEAAYLNEEQLQEKLDKTEEEEKEKEKIVKETLEEKLEEPEESKEQSKEHELKTNKKKGKKNDSK